MIVPSPIPPPLVERVGPHRPDGTLAAWPRRGGIPIPFTWLVVVALVAATPVPRPSHAATAPPAPASGWLLDDGDGTTALDGWGLYHGTLQGGMGAANWLESTPKDYPGNRCLSFDGANDRVLLSLGAILSTHLSSTISAWFQWTDTAPRKEYAIYSERDECQYNVFILEIEDRMGVPAGVSHGVFNRNAFPSACGTGVWNVARDGSGLPSSEDWHHVVAIRKDDGEVRLFVDRVLAEVQAGVPRYIGPTGPTTLGHTHTLGYDSYFAGKLDEIAIWSMALTDSEAVWLYDHSLRDLALAAAPDAPRALSGRPRLSAAPLPYRGGDLRIVWDSRAIQSGGAVDVVLTDLNGRVVREIATAANGRGVFTWDGKDGDGHRVPPGVYFLSGSGTEGRSSVKVAVVR